MKKILFPFFALLLFQACGSKEASKTTTSKGTGGNGDIYGSPPTTTAGSDPLVSYQWHLLNLGNFPLTTNSNGTSSTNTAETDLNYISPSVTGDGVTVLVSDDSVEHFHDDLYANWSLSDSINFLNANYAGSPAPGLRTDDVHGTSVAGIIGAVKNNSTGGYGVAPAVTLAGANTLSSAVSQTNSIFLTQANADVDVINMSWGTTQDNYYEFVTGYDTQVFSASTTRRNNLGTIFVKSAGNNFTLTKSGATRFGNANFDGDNTLAPILVIAAVNADGISSSYSSTGANIWVSAPGGEDGYSDPAIVTTDRLGCNYGYAKSTATNTFNKGTHPTISNTDCKYTSLFNGTSSAAPMVSGAIALLLEKEPTLNWREVRYILAKTAHKLDSTRADISTPATLGVTPTNYPASFIWEYGWQTNSAGFNFHNWYGFGAVDVNAMLSFNTGTIPTGLGSTTQQTETQSDNTTKAITDYSTTPTSYTLTPTPAPAMRVEEVILTVSMTHTNLEDIMIEIVSPDGMKSIVLNSYSALRAETNMSLQRFRSNAFYGLSASGNWTVNFYDLKNTGTGSVSHVSLEFRGYPQ